MPGNIFEYAEQMNSFGIQLHLKQASDGKVVGIKFRIGDDSIKASSVHRSFSAANLQKLIQKNFDTLNYSAQERQKRPKIKSNQKPRFRL